MSELPWFVLALIGPLLVLYLGMALCFAETRAVQAMRRWPFRNGVAAVRFRSPAVGTFGASRGGAAYGVEYRVLAPEECVFVEQGWQSVLSWTRSASPFRLKGHATSGPDGVFVVGRVSLGACVAIPAIGAWLSGCGLLAMAQAPGFSALFVALGLGLPIVGIWFSLPKEIALFRSTWANVERVLRS